MYRGKEDSIPRQTNNQQMKGSSLQSDLSGTFINKAGKFHTAVPRSRGTFREAQHKMARG